MGWFWLISAIGVYIALCVGIRMISRDLLFRPWKFLIDPRLCAVDGVVLEDIDPAADERLYIWHLPPRTRGAPVLIYFDGNRGNISIWNRRWRRIAAAGAGFIAVSYRGYGGSTRQPSGSGLHRDARQVWTWARQHYPVSQLALHGFSLGTGFAARLASKLDRVPVILEAPYTSIADRAGEMLPLFPMSFILRDQISVKDVIGRINGPVMIIHGTKDRIVPARHGRKLFKMANQPKRIELIDGANHLSLTKDGAYDFIWDFLGYAPKVPSGNETEPETADDAIVDTAYTLGDFEPTVSVPPSHYQYLSTSEDTSARP